MTDSEGYRPNVGIILANSERKLLWARRIRQDAWQFPQGGIRRHETPEQAMYRELGEELGLQQEHVTLVGCTRDWLRYEIPKHLVRRLPVRGRTQTGDRAPFYVGQKQIWFLLRLAAEEQYVKLDASAKPEFDRWRWVDYWHPLSEVVAFKRAVYERALTELAPLLFGEDAHSSVSR
ncbi:MAG: RNA pyrophosphohydrolase [Gammaproteobacteria bacterium]|nr:MAG: RNA pyrophosphohydrolase [Gammaproteobacteria bacterium]